MEHYRAQLRHVVRPEDPRDRRESEALTVTDYEAMYLKDALSEYAAYDAPTDEEAEVALAYHDYIEMVVRDEARSSVTLYAHTERASTVLDDAVGSYQHPVDDLHGGIEERIDAVAERQG